MDRPFAHTTRSDGVLGQDEESFRQLFERYYEPITHFFVKRGLSTEDCRDLTQETFLCAHRGISRFRGDSSIETWLFTIAANLWRNTLRSRGTAKRAGAEVSLDEVAAVDISPEGEEEKPQEPATDTQKLMASRSGGPLDDLLEEESVKLLREALDELPPQMRRCVVLRTGPGLRYREIAVVMAISIETVKSQLFQARQRLKGRLAGYFADIEV